MCAKVGLEINDKKTKYFSKKQYKDVTGCVITPQQELKVPNRRRKEIVDIVKNKPIEDMTIKEIRSFYGKLNSMRQIEPNIFQQLYNRAKKQYYKLGAQYSNKKNK
jgi:ribosomal protein L19E